MPFSGKRVRELWGVFPTSDLMNPGSITRTIHLRPIMQDYGGQGTRTKPCPSVLVATLAAR
jgi:hypothetical protein